MLCMQSVFIIKRYSSGSAGNGQAPAATSKSAFGAAAAPRYCYHRRPR
jgi:hypothetical protein